MQALQAAGQNILPWVGKTIAGTFLGWAVKDIAASYYYANTTSTLATVVSSAAKTAFSLAKTTVVGTGVVGTAVVGCVFAYRLHKNTADGNAYLAIDRGWTDQDVARLHRIGPPAIAVLSVLPAVYAVAEVLL